MFEMIVNATDFLWGTPLMILMVGTGLLLSVRTGFFQIRGFGTVCKKTFGELFNKSKSKTTNEGNLSSFQALTTVLAGTVGSGNIAGVAAAIAIGGPGAVFWMWIIALVGMMTKMAEVTLAVKYRKKGENGEFYGGPMHYMRKGMGKAGGILGGIYVVALLVEVITDACFVQTNTLATSAQDVFGIPLIVSGIVLVGLSILIIMTGGIRKIGNVCEKLIPPMVIVFIVGALVVIISNIGNVPAAFAMIFKYAFSPAPAVGGFAGSTISLAVGRGASRGIFSSETGMGTATTVHATAQTDHPIHQGMYGVIEVFIDTIIVCTLTALSIIASGVWCNGHTGVVLTFDAFRSVWGQFGIIILCVSVILFTYSSYLGFFIEFRTCIEYIFGEKSVKYLQWFFFIPPILAVTMEVEAIWSLADIAVGFIVIPNLIALIAMNGKFVELFKEYTRKKKATS
ncbi:alanine/glycine:cation symporter family protein [Abyssisolibacter fermentans]|uniref:alanine/glycine:cation symporter family protein n=1 Tax=Abyssisolibacter fermentans TaxID=1766203 RepID=UPI000829818C|nr:sodium:alanine symporter family protein [Abyssisolibacter fermentans]